MRITIFGASRGVGRAAVDVALANGHEVTAFARNTSALASTGATPASGDVLNRAAVAKALEGADAVLVSLGVTPGKRSSTPADVCSRGTQIVLEEMKARSIDRVVVVSSYGVGETRDRLSFPFSLVAKTLLRGVMEDKELQERFVRESGARWTIIQPMGLTDGPATGRAFAATDGSSRSNQVSRADVAAVCIETIERDAFEGECVSVSSEK